MIPNLIYQIKHAFIYRDLPLLHTISEGILELIGEASEYRQTHPHREPDKINKELDDLSNLLSQVLDLIFKLEKSPMLRYCKSCGKYKPEKDFMTKEGIICARCQLKRIKSVIYHKIK